MFLNLDEILRFEAVSKFFPGVVANDKVNLTIYRGEIHSLLGENGAGKSTLMNILYGLYKADEGQILFEGRPVSILSPGDAIRHGIGMIHQHFMLIPNFTVWENVVLGQRTQGSPVLPAAKLRRRVSALAEELHMKLDVDQEVGELSVGVQQKVEILKAIYRGSRLLVLDEPTSVLTPQESAELFATLEKLKRNGCTVIFISHKLKEVMEISDRVSVLRDGRFIETRDVADCSPEILTGLMVGRNVNLDIEKPAGSPQEVVLELRAVSMRGETHASSLKNVSFQVRRGEIVGIAGVDGNGQTALSQVIAGISQPDSGVIFLHGEDTTREGVRGRTDKKLSYVPADRREEGLTLDFKLFENASLTQYYTQPCSRNGILSLSGMRRRAAEYIEEFHIKTPGTEIPVRNLSGGNQQRLVLAREIRKRPDLLLIVQPTWGLDIGACAFVYQKLLEERARGAAILLISTDLEEVRSLSDRLLVLYEGALMGEVDPSATKVEDIGMMMAGSNIKK